MSRAYRRGPWVAEEDATLLSLVASRGPNNWVQISQHMHFRSPKQCRERYHQNLKSSLNHTPISGEEGEAIEQMVTEMGKKWAEIARRLGNRSDNAVKNWWNGSQNRKKRSVPHHIPSSKTLVNRTQPVPAARPTGSPNRPHMRQRADNAGSTIRTHHDWQGVEHRSPPCGQSCAVESVHARPSSRPYIYDRQRSPRLPHPRPEGLRRPSSPSPHMRGTTDQVGLLLPSLGPINTSQASQSNAIPTLQPPPSAASIDAAPSLVSDHNSVHSISPKTWPSPRSELPPIAARWPILSQCDRRGSAPTISSLVSLPSPGDEGYVSAITPSVASEHKCLLPQPVMRPASLDGHQRYGHRHCSSYPNICTSPVLKPGNRVKEPSNDSRDSRMTFSNLLN